MDNTKLKNRLGSKVQSLQEDQERASELIVIPEKSDYIALNNNALDIIKENLKYQPMSFDLFDIVKSPSGGATVFSVPGLVGDLLRSGSPAFQDLPPSAPSCLCPCPSVYRSCQDSDMV